MSLSLSILASGSSGNCGVLRCRNGVMLIDCGIGPRTAAMRLRGSGVHIADVSAICLTHLDSDHFNPRWISQIVQRKISVWCHESRVDELSGQIDNPDFAERIRAFNGQPFEPLKGVGCRSIRLRHDMLGSHGFALEGAGQRIGWATDLGRVDAELIRHFVGADILAIESNYDPDMQRQSGRPQFLQRRIMGGSGHLSNREAFEAIVAILDRAQSQGRNLPRHIVLLHRSRECNCPNLVRRLFSADDRIARRLILAEQDRPTPWLTGASLKKFVGEQMQLQWS